MFTKFDYIGDNWHSGIATKGMISRFFPQTYEKGK